LTDDEKTKLAEIVKDVKFNINISLIYPNTSLDEIIYFNKSIRMIESIKNMTKEEEIKNKIKDFLSNNYNIIEYAFYLENQYNTNSYFGRSIILHKIRLLIEDNKEKVFSIINIVFSLGKVRKTYDVEETTGFY
jgi:hypothetical protein